jgi:hypothetical protein
MTRCGGAAALAFPDSLEERSIELDRTALVEAQRGARDGTGWEPRARHAMPGEGDQPQGIALRLAGGQRGSSRAWGGGEGRRGTGAIALGPQARPQRAGSEPCGRRAEDEGPSGPRDATGSRLIQ